MAGIRYAERIASCRVLGPGDRAVLWVSGCCFDCRGCIAQNFRKGPYRTASSQEMADWFLENSPAGGLTISGGEPMLQAEGLADMVEKIRKIRDIGLIVYTGFVYEELLERAETENGIRRLLACTDLLIDGPYMEELDDGRPYRGSSNQRFLLLTERYRDVLEDYYLKDTGRKVELILSEEKTLMVGVPAREQAQIWQKIKKLGE